MSITNRMTRSGKTQRMLEDVLCATYKYPTIYVACHGDPKATARRFLSIKIPARGDMAAEAEESPGNAWRVVANGCHVIFGRPGSLRNDSAPYPYHDVKVKL